MTDSQSIIVKVQLPLAGADEVLIYNEDKSIVWQGPYGEDLVAKMDGSMRAFFRAHVEQEQRDGKWTGEHTIVLDERLDEQGW